ncbi:hypothetical protein V2S66_03170 [Streptomyces sp. V4-01]|uniref:Uncharacterized protein n=1 Tax=Actinacidiphila polyblastidii TaxID=3110430 RepID=A0ABU7P577_9ACTN|nr:hypothetical protein [Streptomyces sp. V4-01]
MAASKSTVSVEIPGLEQLTADLHRLTAAIEANDNTTAGIAVRAIQLMREAGEQRDAAAARLDRIAEAHVKHIDAHGGTTGDCVECGEQWPCPTNVWATTDRNPDATWDPADDDPPPACPAGLMPLDGGPVDRCIVDGAHEQHVSALGKRWADDTED